MRWTLLIADQDKTAVRVAQAAADVGWGSFTLRDPPSECVDRLLQAAVRANASHVHPGRRACGLDAGFVRRCARAGLTVVAPPAGVLETISDRGRTRALADAVGVPVVPGPLAPVSWDEAARFLESLRGRAMLLRPASTGHLRSRYVIKSRADLHNTRAQLIGQDGVYVEEFIERSRRVEVQIAGDGRQVVHLWERQPLPRDGGHPAWLAPSGLPPSTRFLLLDAALHLAGAMSYRGMGTASFLLTPSRRFFLLGIDPRLHSGYFVTEHLAGIDLFATQLRLARGDTIADLGLEAHLRPSLPLPEQPPRPGGGTCRLRLNDRRNRSNTRARRRRESA